MSWALIMYMHIGGMHACRECARMQGGFSCRIFVVVEFVLPALETTAGYATISLSSLLGERKTQVMQPFSFLCAVGTTPVFVNAHLPVLNCQVDGQPINS